MKSIYLSFLVLLSVGVFSCKNEVEKDEEPKIPVFPVEVSFEHVVNGELLKLEEGTYASPQGHDYNVNELKYFISNIELVHADGSSYTVPQDSSYFLVNEKVAESKTIHFNAPQGEYVAIRYIIGVDSLRNTMDISRRQGVLDPAGEALGMYWGWNSGYIHFIFEGFSSDIPVELSGAQKFIYHVGGFGGYSSPTINNVKSVELNLEEKGVLIVSESKPSTVHIVGNVGDALRNKITDNAMDFTISPTFMFHRESTVLADNYQHMFTHKSTEN